MIDLSSWHLDRQCGVQKCSEIFQAPKKIKRSWSLWLLLISEARSTLPTIQTFVWKSFAGVFVGLTSKNVSREDFYARWNVLRCMYRRLDLVITYHDVYVVRYRRIGIGSNLYRCRNRDPALVGKLDPIWNANFDVQRAAPTSTVIYGTPSSLYFVRRSLGEVVAIEKQNRAIDHPLAHFCSS